MLESTRYREDLFVRDFCRANPDRSLRAVLISLRAAVVPARAGLDASFVGSPESHHPGRPRGVINVRSKVRAIWRKACKRL